uniref:Myotubularin phosphatase domain-containing protein n=1 Tax=Syphacia muris TaxID=451379 RepID=A0A0N5A9U2_9BILA
MLPRTTSDTFKSYIDVYRDTKTFSSSASEQPDIQLLKGLSFSILFIREIISSHCDNVLFYRPFRENQFGKLYCTNFRLCFVPTVQNREPCCSRSLVLSDDFHFPLCSVEAIYFASSPLRKHFHNLAKRSTGVLKKFRLMMSPVSQLDIVSCLKVFTKVRWFFLCFISDFRVWIFDLQKSQSPVNLANSIYHFSRPLSLSKFFQVYSKNLRAVPSSRLADTSIAFNNQNDWIKELGRCAVNTTLWKICNLNTDRKHRGTLVPSYPLYVIVLNEISDVEIYEKLIPNWRNRRFPIWCWSSSNGCALLRSSRCCHEINRSELWKVVLMPLWRAHPRNRQPRLVDIDITNTKISSCFEKLREFCSFEDLTQFNEREKEWYSLLDATGWCALVFQCLSFVRNILKTMFDGQRSVIITDDDGYNASAIVSSLVQVCADGFYRTINGLNMLIEKEWIALGHPFGVNIFHCTLSARVQPSSPCTASFLLFLDCLYQLLRMYPSSFEYSQHMLIALWDLCVMGFAPALVCNSVSDQTALERNVSVFPLSQYYSSKYCIMFTNVAYSANDLLGIGNLPTLIEPSANPVDVEFWSDCYLRWVSPASIQEGGNITRDVTMSSILANLPSEYSPTSQPVVWRQRLHPAFDSKKICSSFPYSEATDLEFAHNTNVTLPRVDSFRSFKLDLNSTYPTLPHVERRLSESFLWRPAPVSSTDQDHSSEPQRYFPPSSGTLV